MGRGTDMIKRENPFDKILKLPTPYGVLNLEKSML